MVGTLRAPITLLLHRRSRPIREGSPPPLTPLLLQLLKLLTLLKPSYIFPSRLLKPTQWRCGRLAVHLAQDLISCLTLMGNLLWASCILLHQRVAVAAGWRRASVRWRHFAFSSSGAWALARAAPPPPSLPPAAVWSLPCHQLLPLPPT